MTLKLTHTLNDKLELYYGDSPLFTYVYVSQEDPWESRKPYFHPLRTLAGDVLTNFRPNDHRWHHGLAMTCAYVSGQNFWGGNSFVAGKGYIPLDNIGQHEHVAWENIACTPERLDLTERIAWVTSEGQTWIDETRQITVSEIDPDSGHWILDFSLQLQNVSGGPLEFGSPATQGRPDGVGYGGLFWRGARDLTNALVMVADGPETRKNDVEVMGHAGAWLAFVGTHDGVDRSSTIVFIDQPGNPRYPNRCQLRLHLRPDLHPRKRGGVEPQLPHPDR
jgi:hypothetical protein